jgi:predicted TIM-barrel fold metal-dependent hydrolase
VPGAIDLHAHWIPPELAQQLRRRRVAPRIEATADGELFVTWQGRRPFRPLGDLDDRRMLMRRHGVGMQVLSLAGLFGIDCLPVDESAPLVSAFNDAAAAACRADPGRFAALAALPLADIGAACRELDRMQALGLRGAILPADGFASLAAAERFKPLFAAANRLGSHFFVHPGPIAAQPERPIYDLQTDQAWQRRIVLEAQARLSEAIVTLNLSDYLTPYGGVSVQVANLGGTIPFLVERMDEVSRSGGGDLPSTRMRHCYVDTASFGPRAIELAVACFGADRVLFGTDCPIFATDRALGALAEARLDERSRELVLAGNARRLLGLASAG